MTVFAFFEQTDQGIGFMAGRRFAQRKCEVERSNNHVPWSLPESDRPAQSEAEGPTTLEMMDK